MCEGFIPSSAPAVGLIKEIREKVKILEEFYTDSSAGGGAD